MSRYVDRRNTPAKHPSIPSNVSELGSGIVIDTPLKSFFLMNAVPPSAAMAVKALSMKNSILVAKAVPSGAAWTDQGINCQQECCDVKVELHPSTFPS